MGRQLKYPQLLELNIGQSLFIPRTQIGSVQTVRNIVSRLGQLHGLAFAVRDDRDEPHVEVARVARTEAEGAVTIGATTFVASSVSLEDVERDRRDRIGDIMAQLNAPDE